MRAEVQPVDEPQLLRIPSRRGWLRVVSYSLLAAILTASISLVIPKSYKAESRILPNLPGAGSSSLLALAAGSGLADLLSGQIGSENPVLTYPEILHSATLLERTLLSPAGPAESRRIIDALGVRERTTREAIDAGIRKLKIATDVRANPRTGLISVSAITPDSVLSAVIVQRMLAELDRFNVESRTSRGQATRIFVEGRMAEAQREMSQAELALADFRQSNVRIGNSPQLRLREERLEREVQGRSELYQLLARQYEMARIEEKRDTPTFSVIDAARPPVRKYRPKVVLNTVVAFLGAVFIQVAYLYLRKHRNSPGLRPVVTPLA
jgi:tyrosine-protein kinase Etk/Wzc